MINFIIGRQFPDFTWLAKLALEEEGALAVDLGTPSAPSSCPPKSGCDDDPLDDEERADLEQASAMQADLQKLPEPELRAIFETEYQHASEEGRHRQTKTLAVGQHHHDRALANLEYWSSLAAWNAPEAAALFLGKDPRKVSPATLKHKSSSTAFKAAYHKLLRRLERAVEAGHLGSNPVSPGSFLSWAKSNEIPYPVDLEDALLARGHEVQNWKLLYEELADQLGKSGGGKVDIRELHSSYVILHALAFGGTERATEADIKVRARVISGILSTSDEPPLLGEGVVLKHLQAAVTQVHRKKVERRPKAGYAGK